MTNLSLAEWFKRTISMRAELLSNVWNCHQARCGITLWEGEGRESNGVKRAILSHMKMGRAKSHPGSIRQLEKHWHEEFFHSRRTERSDFVVPTEIRNRYLQPPKRPLFHYEELFRLAGDVRGKNVLVFGCGDDNS